MLEYWREYRTQFHIATSWGLSEPLSVSVDSESGNAIDDIGEVSLTWKKAALPKCLDLERTGDRCYRQPKKTATVTKKPRKAKLSKFERQHNRLLDQLRVVAERVNRQCEDFSHSN